MTELSDDGVAIGWPRARRMKGGAWRPIFALIMREMQATYGRSPGGWLWAVAEPIAAIALLSVAFSMALHSPALGASFPLFYASGYLPFMLCHSVAMLVMTSMRYAGRLLDYPRIALIDALLARFLLNFCTQLLVMAVVLAALVRVSGERVQPDWGMMAAAIALAALWAFAIGAINAVLVQLAPVWERIWAVITRPLFLVSGVVFLIEDVPGVWQDILLLNPITHIVSLMRAGLYAGYDAPLAAPFSCALAGLAALALGLAALHLGGKDLVRR